MTTTTSGAFTPSDPDSIYRRLSIYLQSAEDPYIKQAWETALKLSTTERLIRTFVRAVELALYAIDRSGEERHLDTALLESSIRSVLRDMDVRMMRKIPAGIDVYISRSANVNSQYIIPAFTTFTGGGRTLYNRYPITMPIGETVVQARLYVGIITTSSFISTGEDYQEWLSSEDGFTVSDGRETFNGVEYSDMIVYVSGTPVRVTEHDQWWDMSRESDKAVKDRTTIDGRCQLVFGDGQFGYLPPANTTVTVQYVLTKGSADNAESFNSTLVMSNSSTITAYPSAGTNTAKVSALTGGADEVPADTYRKTGPLLYASAGTATRTKSAQAWALNYPGIADALVLGQAKTDPQDRRLMNVKKVCLLKGGVGIDPDDYLVSASEATGWLQHFNKRRPHTVGQVAFYEPIPSSPKIDIILECQAFVTLALAEATARQAVEDLYQYGAGTLRRTILLSELFDVAKYSTEGIKGVRFNGQISDLVTYSRSPIITLTSESETSPRLPQGEYTFYAMSKCEVYNGSDLIVERSALSNPIIYSSTGAYNPVITLEPVVGAIGYELYCRPPNSNQYYLVAELDSRTFSHTVTEVSTQASVMPASSPLMFRFPKLGELNIRAVYVDSSWG